MTEDRLGPALDAALDWTVAHLERFRLKENLRGLLRPARMKGVLELAIMAAVQSDHTAGRSDPRLDTILDFCRSVQDDVRAADQLLRSPRDVVVYAGLYGVLRRTGRDDPHRRRDLARVLDAGYHRQVERLPHRVMELRFLLDWGGLDVGLPPMAELATASVEFGPMSAFHPNDESVYALTHAVMFRCGFGTLPDGFAAGPDRTERTALLEALLIGAVQREHWDLTGELLLCLACTGVRSGPVFGRGLDALLDARSPDGSLPGRADSPAAGAEPGTLEHFDERYHTTLVAILVLGLLRRSAPRPVPPATAPAVATRTTTPPDVPAACARAGDWIAALPPGGGRVAHALSAVGLWIATAHAPAGDPARAAGLDRACRDYAEAARRERPLDGVSAVDALACVLAGSRGHETSFLLTALTEVRGEPGTAGEITTAMRALGYGGADTTDADPDADDTDGAVRLPVGRAELEALAGRVEARTALGDRRPGPDPSGAGALLPGLAADQLTRYDLHLGSRLLRCAAHLGAGGPTVTGALHHLLAQQRSDGSFGFHGPDLPRPDFPGRPPFDPVLQLALPVTVSCLWTVVELADPGWRLFPALRTVVATGLVASGDPH